MTYIFISIHLPKLGKIGHEQTGCEHVGCESERGRMWIGANVIGCERTQIPICPPLLDVLKVVIIENIWSYNGKGIVVWRWKLKWDRFPGQVGIAIFRYIVPGLQTLTLLRLNNVTCDQSLTFLFVPLLRH